MNNKKIKSIMTYISKLISTALLVLLIIVGLFLVYYLVSVKKASKDPMYQPKINLYTIVSGSMEPTIKVYDVIITTAVNSAEDIKVGDVITFKSTSSISEGLIVTHRVIDIRLVNGKYEYVTKGDYNPTADSDTAKFANIIGKVKVRLPQLGRVQFFLATKMGWFIVVLLPAACVIIYDIIKLIKLIVLKNNTEAITTKSTNQDKYKQENDSKDDDELIRKTLEKIKSKNYSSKLDDLKK